MSERGKILRGKLRVADYKILRLVNVIVVVVAAENLPQIIFGSPWLHKIPGALLLCIFVCCGNCNGKKYIHLSFSLLHDIIVQLSVLILYRLSSFGTSKYILLL